MDQFDTLPTKILSTGFVRDKKTSQDIKVHLSFFRVVPRVLLENLSVLIEKHYKSLCLDLTMVAKKLFQNA